DAKTTVEELHAWEFGGPFLEDFTGRKRPADGGEAGAIDEAAPAHARAARPLVGPTASRSAGPGVVPCSRPKAAGTRGLGRSEVASVDPTDARKPRPSSELSGASAVLSLQPISLPLTGSFPGEASILCRPRTGSSRVPVSAGRGATTTSAPAAREASTRSS